MSNKERKINKAKHLLNQALSEISDQNGETIMESRQNIRKAIVKLETVSKKKQSNNQFNEWWGQVEAGTANMAMSPMSSQARERSLEQLNKMIEMEEEKIKEIDDKIDSKNNQLLID